MSAAPGRRWPPAVAVAKIAKVPFWFIWLTPLAFGYLAAAAGGPAQHRLMFAGAAVGICLVDAACNLHNELVDREEDAVNQPRRTDLVASVPEPVLWALVAFGYLYAVAGLVAVFLVLGPGVGLLVLSAAGTALAYNAGPHLKRRPVLAEVAMGWATLSAFLFGWSFNRPLADAPPVAWLLTWLVAITACLKDLPDAAGDEVVGASRLVNVGRPALRRAALAVVYLSPYAVTTGFVAAGWVPARVLAVWALLPVALWLAVLADRRGSTTRMIAAYQLGFLYLHAFALVLLVLCVPHTEAYVAAAALLAGRLAALGLGLDPRLVEPDFSWSRSLRALAEGVR